MSDTAAHRIYREAMQSVIPLNLIYTSTQQMAGRADVLKEDHNGLAMSASRKSTVNRAFSTGFSPLHRPPADARAQQSSTDGPGWPWREGAEGGEFVFRRRHGDVPRARALAAISTNTTAAAAAADAAFPCNYLGKE